MLSPLQAGSDPFIWQSLSLPLSEMGAAVRVLLRVPTIVSGDEQTKLLTDSEGVALWEGLSVSSVAMVTVEVTLEGADSRGNHVGNPDWLFFGVQLHCPTGVGLLGGCTEQLPMEALKDGASCALHVLGYLCGCCLGPSPAWLAVLGASRANTLAPFGPFSPTPSVGQFPEGPRVAQSELLLL